MATSARRIHTVVAAASHNNGIGCKGQLPWRLAGDMRYFALLTTMLRLDPVAAESTQNVVIMGRKTWLSIPPKFRPLPGRVNMVLSRDPVFASENQDLLVFASLDDALSHADMHYPDAALFTIGGASVYAETLARKDCGYVFLTSVTLPAEAVKIPAFDAFMPLLAGEHFRLLSSQEVLGKVLPAAVVQACCPDGSLIIYENGFVYQYCVYEKLQIE
ncbi:dihydrofolate reductase-like domain-containing protein [Chytriomyces sp. MP71]|nr:dihydrofolate reductase-like domain-containing protein [Chytriomyces sp. MP71]